MKVLIVASTWMEARLLADEFDLIREKSNILKCYSFKNIPVDVLISGIGMISTTFQLTNTLMRDSYSEVINIGISSSLNKEIKIGTVVNVVTEELADLGIEKSSGFYTLFETGYLKPDEFPFENGVLKNNHKVGLNNLPKVRGLTSNKSHGRESTIKELFTKFNAHIESTEGAAVFYVCKWLGIPFIELRAVANYVEPFNSEKWNIPLALNNLKEETLKIIENKVIALTI